MTESHPARQSQIAFSGIDEAGDYRNGTLGISRQDAADWIRKCWLDGWVKLEVTVVD